MIDFIINVKSIKPDSIIISGIATSNRLDRHGESITISPNAYKRATTTYQKKDGKVYLDGKPLGLIVAVEHQPISYGQAFTPENVKSKKNVVGMTTYTEYTPHDYEIDSPALLNMKIKFIAEIWDSEIIDDLLSQRINKASLNWITKSWLRNEKTKQRIDTDIVLRELSLVKVPANPDATFTIVDDEALAKQYKLGERVKVYDTLANVKSVYMDQSGRYYVDVDFVDEIVNVKTASKIPFEAIAQDVKVNVKKLYKINVKNIGYSNYPQSARNNARKAIEWKDKYGDQVKGGTQVGWTRAGQLARGERLSLDTVKRIKSFLARHEKNATVDPKFKDEPWRDAGYVAYLIWGGKSMKAWVDKLDLDN